MRMLRLSTGRSRVHAVHQGQHDIVQKGLLQVFIGELVAHRMMLLLIDRFYRMFGNKGMCAACFKDIPAFEMVMRARSNVYHLECFACQQCNHRYALRVLYRRRVYVFKRRFARIEKTGGGSREQKTGGGQSCPDLVTRGRSPDPARVSNLPRLVIPTTLGELVRD